MANIYLINKNNKTIHEIEYKRQQAKDLFIMRNSAHQRALLLFQMTVMDDAFERDDMNTIYSRKALHFIDAFRNFSHDKFKVPKEELKIIIELAQQGRSIQDRAAELIYTEDIDEVNKLLINEVIPIQNKVIKKLTEQRNKQENFLNIEIENIRTLNAKAYWVITVAGVFAIFLAIIIAWYVWRHNKSTRKLELDKKLAEEENIAKTEFLANMSHELRTPIHAILSFSKFGLVKKKADREKVEDYFNNINTSGKRLIGLVDNLLDLAKLESGKFNFNFNKSNLCEVLDSCIYGVSSLLENKNITITNNTEKNLKEIVCDSKLISQVFINLLSNAIKFSEYGGTVTIDTKIVIDELSQKEKFYFSVTDQGVGIPENELNKVFDKFIQSSNTNDGSGGTGLGLAISKEIIEAHKGKIWAEPGFEKGARFVIVIPTQQTITQLDVA